MQEQFSGDQSLVGMGSVLVVECALPQRVLGALRTLSSGTPVRKMPVQHMLHHSSSAMLLKAAAEGAMPFPVGG